MPCKNSSESTISDWDEALTIYDTYSINETEKDECGDKFSLFFRSINDYNRLVYVYLDRTIQTILLKHKLASPLLIFILFVEKPAICFVDNLMEAK